MPFFGDYIALFRVVILKGLFWFLLSYAAAAARVNLAIPHIPLSRIAPSLHAGLTTYDRFRDLNLSNDVLIEAQYYRLFLGR